MSTWYPIRSTRRLSDNVFGHKQRRKRSKSKGWKLDIESGERDKGMTKVRQKSIVHAEDERDRAVEHCNGIVVHTIMRQVLKRVAAGQQASET